MTPMVAQALRITRSAIVVGALVGAALGACVVPAFAAHVWWVTRGDINDVFPTD